MRAARELAKKADTQRKAKEKKGPSDEEKSDLRARREGRRREGWQSKAYIR